MASFCLHGTPAGNVCMACAHWFCSCGMGFVDFLSYQAHINRPDGKHRAACKHGTLRSGHSMPDCCSAPKIDWTQMPWDELREVAGVMTDPRGSAWRDLPLSAHKQSLGRHFAAAMLDEPDPDTGKSSLLYVAARALMARAAQKKEGK